MAEGRVLGTLGFVAEGSGRGDRDGWPARGGLVEWLSSRTLSSPVLPEPLQGLLAGTIPDLGGLDATLGCGREDLALLGETGFRRVLGPG